MIVNPIKTKIFKKDDNLLEFIFGNLGNISDGSIIVVTSKIVALSEGRIVYVKNKKEKERLIKKESDFAIKTKLSWLTIRDGLVMASAGIDESNSSEGVILLPKNSFNSAEHIRKYLIKKFKIKNLGVLITDSRTFPLRAGVVGSALGYAGFKGVRDYRGKKDIFGRIMRISRTNIADCLATTAVLCMGEGKERFPLAVIKNAPVSFVSKINKKETFIDLDLDLYLPLLKQFNKIDKLQNI